MPGSQVPTPYAAHRHPYPTRFHGGIWKRPVFGLPYVHEVQNVIRPVEFYSQYGSRGETVYAGLGNTDKQGPLPVVLNQGLFRTRGQGGGIFNQVLAGTGMGSTTTSIVAFGLGIAAGVLLAKYGPKALRPNEGLGESPRFSKYRGYHLFSRRIGKDWKCSIYGGPDDFEETISARSRESAERRCKDLILLNRRAPGLRRAGARPKYRKQRK